MADALLQDPQFLIHGEPSAISAILQGATTERARLAAAVYRASYPVHHALGPSERQQVLALDAARLRATELADAFARDTDWRPLWATGSQVSAVQTAVLTGFTGAVLSIATTELDGRPVAVTGDGDGVVRVWDLTTGCNTFAGYPGWIFAVTTADLDGRPVVLLGGEDGTLRVWDLTTGDQASEPLTGHAGWIFAVTTTELDGCPVAVTGGGDGTVRVWDLTTSHQVGEPFRDDYREVLSVTTTKLDDRPCALSGGVDGRLRIWDLATGHQIRNPVFAHAGVVHAVATTQVDGHTVAVTGGSDWIVRVWDLTTGSAAELGRHDGEVNAVATAEVDGRPLALTGSDDGKVRVWDLVTNQQARPPMVHAGVVRAVSTTTVDGHPIAVTGGHDMTARVWDLATHQQVGAPVTGHVRPVRALATTELEGRAIAITGTAHGEIRVWDVASGDQVEIPIPDGLRDSPGFGLGLEITTTKVTGRPCAIITIIGGPGSDELMLWNLATGYTSRADPQAVGGVVTTQVGRNPVVVQGGAHDGRVEAWVLDSGRGLRIDTGFSGTARAVVAMQVGRRSLVLLRGAEGQVQVWELASGRGIPLRARLRCNLAVPADFSAWWVVRAVATARKNGRPVALFGGQDGTVRAWDLITGHQTGNPLTGHTGSVRAVATAKMHGCSLALTSSDDRTLRVWDLDADTCLTTLAFPDIVKRLVILPDDTAVLGMGHEVIGLTLAPLFRRQR